MQSLGLDVKVASAALFEALEEQNDRVKAVKNEAA